MDHLIRDLQRIRFFNRFDRETLYEMVKMCDLRVVQQNNILFLEKDECAIIVNGGLHLFTHKDNVQTPSLQAVYTSGDIIGDPQIDNGWSRDTHSWLIAYHECDFIVLKLTYISYLWDKMKQKTKLTTFPPATPQIPHTKSSGNGKK